MIPLDPLRFFLSPGRATNGSCREGGHYERTRTVGRGRGRPRSNGARRWCGARNPRLQGPERSPQQNGGLSPGFSYDQTILATHQACKARNLGRGMSANDRWRCGARCRVPKKRGGVSDRRQWDSPGSRRRPDRIGAASANPDSQGSGCAKRNDAEPSEAANRRTVIGSRQK